MNKLDYRSTGLPLKAMWYSGQWTAYSQRTFFEKLKIWLELRHILCKCLFCQKFNKKGYALSWLAKRHGHEDCRYMLFKTRTWGFRLRITWHRNVNQHVFWRYFFQLSLFRCPLSINLHDGLWKQVCPLILCREFHTVPVMEGSLRSLHFPSYDWSV